MSKRSVYTTITPLPAGITRETVLEFLFTHVEMIDLNPLVEERHPIKPPAKATPEEYHCIWYSLTDKIQYVPGAGDLATGKVTYTACFHNLQNGIQTHVYAPMGLDIKNKWTINGSMPGEPTQPHEIGKGIPLSGLYLREDVDMRCNMLMTSFVKKNLRRSHSALIDRLIVKAQILEAESINDRFSERGSVRGRPLSNAGGSVLGRSPGSSPSMSSLSLAHKASTRSSMGSLGFASPNLMPAPLYQGQIQDSRGSYLQNPYQQAQTPHQPAQVSYQQSQVPYQQSQLPYQQGYDPSFDPRFAMQSYPGQEQQQQQQLQPHQDAGYQAYLESQRQKQGAMPVYGDVAEMSAAAPKKMMKEPQGEPPVHPVIFLAELA